MLCGREEQECSQPFFLALLGLTALRDSPLQRPRLAQRKLARVFINQPFYNGFGCRVRDKLQAYLNFIQNVFKRVFSRSSGAWRFLKSVFGLV